MEQKRTLWILIAAGVFLCAVFGFAYGLNRARGSKNATAISLKGTSSIWMSPSTSTKPAVKEPEPTYTQGVVSKDEEVKAPELREGLSAPQEGVPTVTAGDNAIAQTDNLTVIANGPTNVYVPESKETVNSNGTTTTTFDFSSYTNAYSSGNVTAANKAGEQALKNKETVPAKTLDESASKKTASTTTKKTDSKASSKTTEKKAATSTAIPDRYWVQAASYSSKNKAEEARSLLDENKIQCEVFTFDSNGTLYYRVRVGPYSTKDEATYWKKQVDEIALFAEAGTYIVNSSAPLAKK
ncbi:MAG: SPOR domain-containing protein [Treponema sp.]|nr:SPOR domain-containing protein [Treponema sp.]